MSKIEEVFRKHNYFKGRTIFDKDYHIEYYTKELSDKEKILFNATNKKVYISCDRIDSETYIKALDMDMVKAIYDKCKELKMLEVEDEEQ